MAFETWTPGWTWSPDPAGLDGRTLKSSVLGGGIHDERKQRIQGDKTGMEVEEERTGEKYGHNECVPE